MSRYIDHEVCEDSTLDQCDEPRRREPPAYACRCGLDAPGRCPGWTACPMWEADEDEEEEGEV